jgi:hypothetical protein
MISYSRMKRLAAGDLAKKYAFLAISKKDREFLKCPATRGFEGYCLKTPAIKGLLEYTTVFNTTKTMFFIFHN